MIGLGVTKKIWPEKAYPQLALPGKGLSHLKTHGASDSKYVRWGQSHPDVTEQSKS